MDLRSAPNASPARGAASPSGGAGPGRSGRRCSAALGTAEAMRGGPRPAEGRAGRPATPRAPGRAAATSAAGGKGPAPASPSPRFSAKGRGPHRRPQDAAGAEAHLQRVPQHVLLHVEEGRPGRDLV